MASSLLEKLKKTTSSKYAAVLAESTIVNNRTLVSTQIPALNIALSGDIDGGYYSGITSFVGETKNFKSLACLVCAKAYLDKFNDSILVFYDSEMGSGKDYFLSVGIDPNRVLHIPVTNVEELKFEIVSQLEAIERGEHVVMVIDSIGNLASKKEVEDAIEQKAVADMSRAKAIKSLCRIITPMLTEKDIPLFIVNHVIQTIGLFSTTTTTGGSGLKYSQDNCILITRSQEKQGTDVIGYNFNMKVMKSRHARENSVIPLTVTFKKGISPWSGLLELALKAGYVIKPSNGWYQRVNPETGEVEEKKCRASETNCASFWNPIIKSNKFKDWIRDNYRVVATNLLNENLEFDESDYVPNIEMDESITVNEVE